jgi:hypothetical protein
MIAQERAPGLRWRAAWSSPAIASNRTIADHDDQLEQFTSDRALSSCLALAKLDLPRRASPLGWLCLSEALPPE